jgi:predicted ATPase
MADLPTGTVTLLFTDIEGSTKLLHELGERYGEVLAEQRRLLRDAFRRHGGVEVDTQGDSFFYAFASARDALAAAAEAQSALSDGPVAVRIGLHTGEPTLTEEGYVCADVHQAARIMGAGHGGQVLVSAATRAALGTSNNLFLVDLGEHRLKDIEEAVSIFQLGGETFPPLNTISNTNLPRPASSFVGRASELDEVLALLRAPSVRLLTLTGPGGSGKTRLAIEAAAELVGEYRSGVFWVPLAPLREPSLVTATIAQTLGAKDGVAEHIGERELLLLLDNLEQVVEAAPELSALLEACPNLTLLTTSRELLRVRGELEYEVPPLAQPEAVALFCERARVDPSAEIDELCARLDNLPLAVELAAARAKALSPAQILERLSQRLDLLKGGRDADPRQQTLRSTIEWSHDLLTPEEQRLFRRLCVFVGGCTLEAAEEVAGADVDTLQSLVEKSMLRFTHGRYWMLETIREYAAERLEDSSEAEQLRRRHAHHYVDLAVQARRELRGTQARQWLDRVHLENANVREALLWAIDRSESELASSIIGGVWFFWLQRGHATEGRALAEEALARDAGSPPFARAGTAFAASELARAQGDLVRGRELKEQALTLFRQADHKPGEAATLYDLAGYALAEGRYDDAGRLLEQSLAVRRDVGDPWGIGQALHGLGNLARLNGAYGEAISLYQESLSYAREAGTDEGVSASLAALAKAYANLGDRRRAKRALAESLRLVLQLRAMTAAADCLEAAAGMRLGDQDADGAARLLGAADRLRKDSATAVEDPQAHAELVASASAELDSRVFGVAWDDGRAMSFDDAVNYALVGLDESREADPRAGRSADRRMRETRGASLDAG